MAEQSTKQPAEMIDANETITVPQLFQATGCTSANTKAKILERLGIDVVSVASGSRFVSGRHVMLAIEKMADEDGMEAARKRLGL